MNTVRTTYPSIFRNPLVSLEARVPLLDHRVVEFAQRIPMSLKYRDGKRRWHYYLWDVLMFQAWLDAQ